MWPLGVDHLTLPVPRSRLQPDEHNCIQYGESAGDVSARSGWVRARLMWANGVRAVCHRYRGAADDGHPHLDRPWS